MQAAAARLADVAEQGLARMAELAQRAVVLSPASPGRRLKPEAEEPQSARGHGVLLRRRNSVEEPRGRSMRRAGRSRRATVVAITVVGAVGGLLGSTAVANHAPTQDVPPNTASGVCDQYAGDPDAGTPEWSARTRTTSSARTSGSPDAQANPAYLAKVAEQNAVEAQEFATVTGPEWAAEPNRLHLAGAAAFSARVGDPFRSPEEWAAAGRGRHLKFSFINRDGAKLRARLYAPNDTSRTYPAVTFTPGAPVLQRGQLVVRARAGRGRIRRLDHRSAEPR